jgi:hypothetical protein
MLNYMGLSGITRISPFFSKTTLTSLLEELIRITFVLEVEVSNPSNGQTRDSTFQGYAVAF